ncbi:MAG: B12-binding domain-containing radical SAM protein [Peptococcaceae bacterium]|nr:B12-binding domain-containing radical SAM protein [Peptococcaceae bacterium]
MRIYMLNPPYFPHFIRSARWQDTGRGGTLYYPIWLAYAAGVLEREFETRLVDAPAWKWDLAKVLEDIDDYKPSLVVVDSSFPSLNNDMKVADAIKANIQATVVLVGPPASQFPVKILKNSNIDIVARLEYDHTLLEIARQINEKKNYYSISGISYKDNGTIVNNPNRDWISSSELDKIPFVSKVYKSHLNVKDYFLGSSLYPEVQIFTGRGCPNLCTFCSWPETLMGRTYRVRSVENVLDELEWIEENLPEVKEVFFEDDTFTISKQRIAEYCRGYKMRNLKIAWACNARATLDLETMKLMKKAGCRLVIVGYESGDEAILKNIKKGITTEHIKKFAVNARKAGLLVHGDFIIGLPGETKDTIEKTKKLINEVKPDILQVSVASPFPGTDFYRWAGENGYLITDDPNEYLDDQGHQKAIISYPWLSAKDITENVDDILKKYYLSIRYVPLAIRQVARTNWSRELNRMLYSVVHFLKYIKQRPYNKYEL